jgi:transposase-like protein
VFRASRCRKRHEQDGDQDPSGTQPTKEHGPLSERILNAELDEHLGEERAEGNANRRNGSSRKSVLTGTSKMRLTIPRDRAGTFDPKLIAKYQRRFPV